MPDFSLSLNEDQLQIQKWTHDFAEGVIRPAAHEWDEREEFPWPVVQEAAQIGLYGIDFLLNAMGDPTGLTLPVAIEEIFWGDAGIGMAIMGTAWPPPASPATARPSRSWSGSRSVTAPLTTSSSAPSASPSPTQAPTSRACAPGPSTTRPRTSGRSTAPRRGSPMVASPTCTWSSPASTPNSRARARRASSSRRARRPVDGSEVPQARHPCEPHLRGRPRRRQGPRIVPARWQGEARREAGPRP